jgi:hypothetical protein
MRDPVVLLDEPDRESSVGGGLAKQVGEVAVVVDEGHAREAETASQMARWVVFVPKR